MKGVLQIPFHSELVPSVATGCVRAELLRFELRSTQYVLVICTMMSHSCNVLSFTVQFALSSCIFNYCKTEDVLSYKTTLLLLHLVLPLTASIRNVNKPPPPGVVKQRHVYGVLRRLIARDRVKLIPPPSNWGGCFLPYIKSCFPSRRQQFDSD